MLKKGIRHSFPANRACRSVARIDPQFIPQGKNFTTNRRLLLTHYIAIGLVNTYNKFFQHEVNSSFSSVIIENLHVNPTNFYRKYHHVHREKTVVAGYSMLDKLVIK